MTIAIHRIGAALFIAICAMGIHSSASAQLQIDSRRLALATARAEQRWERLSLPATARLLDLKSIVDGEGGILGLIVGNLDYEDPSRDGAVLRYVNDILLPSIRNRRAEYTCSITKEFYFSVVPTDALSTFEMPALSFIHELVWFSLPTLPYLEREDLHFGQNAWQFFELSNKDPEKSHFGIWNGGKDARLPCEAEFVSWNEPMVP